MTQYLIRFDDIYTGMDPVHFEKVTQVLRANEIPAVLGVTPAWEVSSFADTPPTNKPTPPAQAEPFTTIPPETFWSTLRELAAIGCEMSLHGYCHKLHFADNYFNINAYGEFAGLPLEEQTDRLSKGFRIMAEQGLTPRMFMPPAHSIDKNTLTALKKVGIAAITDGKTFYPHYVDGVLFVPQITSAIKAFPFGLITICLHPQYMTDDGYVQLANFVQAHRSEIVSVEKILRDWQREPAWAKLFNHSTLALYQWRSAITKKPIN